MNDIFKKLGIDETFTKEVKKPKYFNKIKDNIPLQADWNFMADLIEMPMTKKRYKYLLVCDDLATDEFDIEPIKNKEPSTVLSALQTMFKRNFIKKPKYSLSTDGGSEFQGVFHKWLYNESIYHKVSLPNRHSQMSAVESLNKQIERVLNGYMNRIEEETNEPYNEWTDVLDTVRIYMNKLRKKPEHNPVTFSASYYDTKYKPKFKVGDVVYRQSDVPLNALGNKQPTNSFRVGDYRFENKVPRKITKILYMSGQVPYRYMLSSVPRASYTEDQLILAENEKETKYVFKKIIDKKIMNKKPHYLIWWAKELKRNATWEPEAQLIKDGLKDEIDEFNKNK